jgi:hypothetical protein
MSADAEKLADLRAAVQHVLDGDYPNPRQHRPGKCGHGVYYCRNNRRRSDYLISELKMAVSERRHHLTT